MCVFLFIIFIFNQINFMGVEIVKEVRLRTREKKKKKRKKKIKSLIDDDYWQRLLLFSLGTVFFLFSRKR